MGRVHDGDANSISIDTNDSAYAWTPYQAAYFQDDLRITNKLRLNLGLRFERNGGSRERYDRALGGGFDWGATYAFADDVRAQYAKNPIPELAPQDLKIQGGNYYLGKPNKTWTSPFNMLMPKAALVYQLNNKTVLRVGYGWWYDGSFNVNNDRPAQDGYSQATSTQITTDNGLTFCCGVGAIGNLAQGRTLLADPFPTVRAGGARFDTPYGNSLGAYIRVGRGYTFRPYDFRSPKQQRIRFSIQREITRDLVVDVSYNGAYARTYLEQRIDYLPAQYWAQGNVRRQDVDDWLNANLPNPFRLSAIPGVQAKLDAGTYTWLINQGFFNGTNIRRNVLLRGPYLHMNGLNGYRPGQEYENKGKTIYHDVQIQLDKRFSKHLTYQVMYTWATGRDADWFMNQFDTVPTWRPNQAARGHRFVTTGIFELPFGKGRTWVTQNPVQHVVGGWNLGWIYNFQSGPVVGDWGNQFFYGDMSQILTLFDQKATQDRDMHQWFRPDIAYKGTGAVPANFVGFEGRSNMRPGDYHVRVFPSRIKGLRADGINKWDLKIERQFRISERARTRFSVDLLNAFNHTSFSGPNIDPTSTNFGKVTSQRGPSRIIQLNLRVEF
ncbi:MAG: TonB-dependent receptor domain-containing protein [Bryobacteraceae bacterium]